MKKKVIVDFRNVDIVRCDLDNCENIMFLYKDIDAIKNKKANKYVCVSSKNEVDEIRNMDDPDMVICSECTDILNYAAESGFLVAAILKVDDEESLRKACELAWCNYIFVDFNFSTNIPLELLLATYGSTSTLVLKFIHSYEEAKTVLCVMEKGSDGLIVQPNDSIKEIANLCEMCDNEMEVSLKVAKVTRIAHLGMGIRACIDTTSILEKNSGMLVGSTSNGGILISSETHYLPYMKTRPFRVNAGAVHSYVFSSNDTKYISEMIAGDTVTVVDTYGKCRNVSVGRIKLEKRPLLLIEALSESGELVNAIVQDDWHIRIFSGTGEVLNVTDLNINDDILVYICNPGRHVGLKIDEYIQEK